MSVQNTNNNKSRQVKIMLLQAWSRLEIKELITIYVLSPTKYYGEYD